MLRLPRATDAAIEQVDLTAASAADLVTRFREAMKARYPKERIIYMEPNSPSNDGFQPTVDDAKSRRG